MGREIHGADGMRRCDAHGFALANANLPGDGWRIQHDEVSGVVLDDVLAQGVLTGERTPRDLFAHLLPQAHQAGLQGAPPAIEPDVAIDGLTFVPAMRGAARLAQKFLGDFKMFHLGCGDYTKTRRHREERGFAVKWRESQVHKAYVRHARHLDELCHNVPAEEVRAGRRPEGPVLRALLAYPDVVGYVFGGYGEMGPHVEGLLRDTVTAMARDWRAIGSRSEAEARSFLTSMLYRRWGVTAARAAARLRLSRVRYVGLSRQQVQAMRRAPRPAVGRDAADVRHELNVLRFDEHAGADLGPAEGARDDGAR